VCEVTGENISEPATDGTQQGNGTRLESEICVKIGSMERKRKIKEHTSQHFVQWALVPEIAALKYFPLI
jgi:hypothetical protein